MKPRGSLRSLVELLCMEKKAKLVSGLNTMAESVMSFDELVAFLQNSKNFAQGAVSSIAACSEAAESALKTKQQIKGWSAEETEFMVHSRAAMFGVPSIYLVYMCCAALDAYFRGVCLLCLKAKGFADDSWFSLTLVDAVTGVVLSELPAWKVVGMVYDARTVLNRLEFTMEWDEDFVLALPDRFVDLAKEFSSTFVRMRQMGSKNDPEAAS